jgi:hypothetical protein
LVVDAILRATEREKPELFARTQTIFHADDGRIGGKTTLDVQEMLDLIMDKFAHVGLSTNTVKTVSMTNWLKFCSLDIAHGAKAVQMNAKELEKQWNAYTKCEICGKILQNQLLKRHCHQVQPSDIASHVHPPLWSPSPVPTPEQDWTVYWDRDDTTQKNIPIACPWESCLSFRFKSLSQIYQHWSIARHDGRLFVIDHRDPIHTDATS